MTDTVTPDITKVTDTPDAMPKPLTKDNYKHLYRCRGQIPSVNASPCIYQMEKDPNMKADLFLHVKDYCINMSQIHTGSSWLLSYLKYGNT